jgi:DHA2 family multidrug resistance protein-like MFS transporter
MMMLGMLSLIGLIVTAIAFVRRTYHFVLMMPLLVVFGLGSFAFAPAALASLGDLAPSGGRGTTMGLYSVAMNLGLIIGPLLGGYLLDRYGLPSLFYAALIILMGALALAIVIAGPDFRSLQLTQTNSFGKHPKVL